MTNPNSSVKKDKIKIIDWLVENFPAAFFKKANHIRPLKIGIFDDIMDFYERLDNPPFSKKGLSEALNYYSTSPAYLTCQKVGAARVDLFGNEMHLVTEEQAKYAHQRYQQRYLKKQVTESETPPRTDSPTPGG